MRRREKTFPDFAGDHGVSRLVRMSAAVLIVAATSVAATPAAAQLPRVGIIDFYGRKSVSEAVLRGALQLKEGDTITAPKDSIVARLRRLPGVRDADVSFVCCEANRTIVYVGIQEGAPSTIRWNPRPTGSVLLPNAIFRNDSVVMSAMMDGVRAGEAGEDDSRGYTVYKYPPARAAQGLFISYVPTHLTEIRAVMRSSGNDRHRALATELIPYAGPSAATIADLQYASRDPSPDVRNNALRALGVIAMYAHKHPEARLHVPAEGIADLLRSIYWTDRNKAAFALAALTESRDPALLSTLATSYLDPLIEMTRWKSSGHAMMAAMILGRVGGMTDAATFETLQRNRERIIQAALRRRGPAVP